MTIGVFPKIMVPPNHPFVHRIGTIIFTIHFGGKIPLFWKETPIIYLHQIWGESWTIIPARGCHTAARNDVFAPEVHQGISRFLGFQEKIGAPKFKGYRGNNGREDWGTLGKIRGITMNHHPPPLRILLQTLVKKTFSECKSSNIPNNYTPWNWQ